MIILNDSSQKKDRSVLISGIRKGIRLLFILLLATVVFIEGYYIFVLRDKINKQTEELKNISLQLQFLKNERDNLHEELSSVKKSAGESQNGNTTER